MPIDIIGSRLRNQRLCASRLPKPEDIVGWLGAVQAQEYTDTKWALGLRMRRASDDTIERAFTAGRILRTHVLRPTWHFVTPDDIRWMLALTGLRVELCRKEDLMRPSEPDVIRVDVGKLRRETGWSPRYSLDRTLADTLEAWRRG